MRLKTKHFQEQQLKMNKDLRKSKSKTKLPQAGDKAYEQIPKKILAANAGRNLNTKSSAERKRDPETQNTVDNQDTEYNENDSIDGFPSNKHIEFKEEDKEAVEVTPQRRPRKGARTNRYQDEERKGFEYGDGGNTHDILQSNFTQYKSKVGRLQDAHRQNRDKSDQIQTNKERLKDQLQQIQRQKEKLIRNREQSMGRLEKLKNDPVDPTDPYSPQQITGKLKQKVEGDRASKIQSSLSFYGPPPPKESVRTSYDVNRTSQADMKQLLKNFQNSSQLLNLSVDSNTGKS